MSQISRKKHATACGVTSALLLTGLLYAATRSGWSLGGGASTGRITPVENQGNEGSPLVVPKLGPSSRERGSDGAYVALQYGGFFLALRVLGQSLRESGTTFDMVALCMPDVPPYQREILKKDGWIVKTVDPLPRACVGEHVFSRHFVKIQAWLLAEYRRVISIDSDAIVLHNIDSLFSCGEFCSAYRHSDLFNTGVVVLKPSVDTFKNMCSEIQTYGSYTNGDQGFLNYFYKNLKNASMFSAKDGIVHHQEKFQRLPAEYNGDVSVFYLVNKWMYIDTEEPYVLHYTLGPVKPWKWWSYPLFSLNWRWKHFRDRLPHTDLKEPSLFDCYSWLPIAVLLAVGLSSRVWCKYYIQALSNGYVMRLTEKLISPVNGLFTKIFPTVVLFLACYLAYPFVPLAMSPLPAWTRYGLWVLLFFTSPYSAYCLLVYVMGAHSERDASKSAVKSTPRVWRVAGECLLWFSLATFIFYMQFSIPTVLLTMKRRSVTFIGLGVANFVLCYWYGRRLIGLCYKLGAGAPRI